MVLKKRRSEKLLAPSFGPRCQDDLNETAKQVNGCWCEKGKSVKAYKDELKHAMKVMEITKRNKEKFKDKVKELVNTETKDLWGLFMGGILEACEELCRKRK